jgi:hypothetical protein
MVSKAKTLVEGMEKIDKNHPYEPIRTYTTKAFLIDLEESIKLPRYFKELDFNFDELVETGNIECLGRSCWALKDFGLQLPLSLA